VPIELVVVGDRDEDKTGGLARMLRELSENGDRHLVDLRGIWANIFRADTTRDTLRTWLRRTIDELAIPLNKPFDRHVVRPERGRAVVSLPGGLDISVLGPTPEHIAALHRMSTGELKNRGVLEPLIAETFGGVNITTDPLPLHPPPATRPKEDGCVPSENARRQAGGEYSDRSVPNLSSVIALFQFRGSTFLFTADSRGDLILDSLSRAGLLDAQGQLTVDLMTIPHLGSPRNITVDFFRRVRAHGYLFSGDGTYNNPSTTTVASLITARECDAYRMYFVNREGGRPPRPDPQGPVDTGMLPADPEDEASGDDPHGERLDEFFKAEQPFNANYRRVFRSATGGSVIIDLLNPVRD
jgi:hypothetical protein